MALQITYDELRRAVGRFLGMNRTVSAIEANAQWNADVEDCLISGLREFYRPRKVAEGQPFHIWSFLLRSFTVNTRNGYAAYDLPEDFSGMGAGLSFDAGIDNPPPGAIGEEEIRRLAARTPATGPPTYYAVRARQSHQRTRYEVLLYPTPDAEYELTARYPIEPDPLSDDNIYPLGGALHSETILESCLSAAEKQMNPESGGEGIHAKRFMELLMASMEADANLIPKGMEESFSWALDSITGPSALEPLIGRFIGVGANPATWTHGQQSEIAEIVRSGLRNFLLPPIIPGERYAHRWSFLRPVLQVQLTANVDTLELPIGFSMMNGPLTYVDNTSLCRPEIEVTAESIVRKNLRSHPCTGRPEMTALRLKRDVTENAYELVFWPTPNDDYLLDLPCKMDPDMYASGATELPGGNDHAQTVLESCLAAAEQMRPELGNHHQQIYMVRLASSISYDLEKHSPDTLGYNGDRSDVSISELSLRAHTTPLLTINGNIPY